MVDDAPVLELGLTGLVGGHVGGLHGPKSESVPCHAGNVLAMY